MLNAVRGMYARQAYGTKRGRPGRFAREVLLRVDSWHPNFTKDREAEGAGAGEAAQNLTGPPLAAV